MGTRAAESDGDPPAESVPLGALPIDPEVRHVLEAEGIQSLYPPQAEALGPVLEGKSLLLACPTASGKSLVAYLALLRAWRQGRTGLYLVPLRALAHEKHEELEAFAPLGLRVGLSIGDFDLPAPALERLDVLVATSEKADALLRRGSPWLDRLGVVVADEIHLLRDPDRGPTLEVALTRLRRDHPGLQVVGLSATVGNAAALAGWLGGGLVESRFRPVPLRTGVYRDGRITFSDETAREVPGPGDPVPRLVRTVIEEGGQALVFVNTRRSSEQLAQALATTVRAVMRPEDRARARGLGETLGAVGEEETEGIRRLATLLPNGVAFHNASLTNPERRLVERAFRDRVLRALVATPTLAAGINLPARRVVVRDTTRYEERLGVQAPIPTLEVQQMLGRAGRPRYDRVGESVLLARSVDDEERLFDQYLASGPEAVESRLAAEPALRMHLLALVATGGIDSEAGLESFFGETFYGHTLPLAALTAKVRPVREFLETHGLLEPGDPLRASRFGALTSALYLDPMTAVVLRQAIERAPIGVGPFPLLSAIAATPDLTPLFLRRGEETAMLGRFTDESPGLLVQPEEPPLDLDLDLFLATVKTAEVLESWIDETPIVEISERFGIGAGDLRGRVEDADWLLFGASRLAVEFNRRVSRAIDDLSLRVRYGVREELLDLVRLRGVARVRARALFDRGFRDRDAVRTAPIDRLEQALKSRTIAEAVQRAAEHPGKRGPAVPPRDPAPAAPAPGSPRRRPTATRPLEEYPEAPDRPGAGG